MVYNLGFEVLGFIHIYLFSNYINCLDLLPNKGSQMNITETFYERK